MENLLLLFLIALALGALVGLEREYARYRQRGQAYGGIRTFPLLALFGCLAAYLGATISIWILVVSLFLAGVMIITTYLLLNDKAHLGATTEIAGFLTFFIGMMVYYGPVSYAVMLAIIMTLILHLRSLLHHFAKKITARELRDMLLFGVITFVILPFLPNQWYGPGGLFNPYVLWLMVILISAINFIGYALIKWYGERGTSLAGALGGIISSTAVSVSFAQRSKKQRNISRVLAVGILLANAVMFVKVLVEVFFISPSLLWLLMVPFLFLAGILAGVAYFWFKHTKPLKRLGKVNSHLSVRSPLSFRFALEFGIFFAVLIAIVKLAQAHFPASSVYLISFLSGIADVDAITISLSQLVQQGLAPAIAAKSIFIAALTNTMVKGSFAWWFGSPELRRLLLYVFPATLLLGILFLVLW